MEGHGVEEFGVGREKGGYKQHYGKHGKGSYGLEGRSIKDGDCHFAISRTHSGKYV
jgi:hypothetical protein